MKTTTVFLMLATAAVLGLGWMSRAEARAHREPVVMTMAVDLSGLDR